MGVHLPTYLIDRGLSVEIGGWTFALIGLFNVVGSIGSGWLGNKMPKRFILAAIYFRRSLAIIIYILLPVSSAATVTFGVVMGILWLSTISPTSSLVAIMFGERWLAMLLGVAFVSHQLGGFLGSGSEVSCSNKPGHMTPFGGSRSCLACFPPRSIYLSSKSQFTA